MLRISFIVTFMIAAFGVQSLEEVQVQRQTFRSAPAIPQRILIPKPNPQQQCRWIQGVGNPINLLKVLIDIINKNLSQSSQSQVTLIYQQVSNNLYYFVFKMYSYQSVDYIAIVYKDGFNQGAVIHQILSEDLQLINRALNLRVFDNTSIYCPDIICSWNGTCSNATNCQNCPNCPGCQTPNPFPTPVPQYPPYCNQCPYCQGCPRANQGGFGFNSGQGQFGQNQFTGGSTGGSRGGVFILGESAPETDEDKKE